MDIKNFMASGEPAPQPQVKKESMFGQVVGQYNEYGNTLRQSFSMRELAEKLMEIAEFAEQTLTTETAPSGEDWYDAHTIKRNVKEMRSYVKEFGNLAEEYDTIRSRATALYDDMGRVLERYFEITGYDTDDDQAADLVPGNAEKSPIQRGPNTMGVREEAPAVETPEDDVDVKHAKNKNLQDRILRLARHQLKGEQLARFDTLPEDTQLRAAWKIIR